MATPCRRKRSGAASQTDDALEEVEGAGAGGERLDGLGREELDGLDDGLDLAAGLALDLVGQAQDGDHQRDVGLDGGDDLAGARRAPGVDEAQEAVAGLGERRERLERLEGGGQAAAVALVVAALEHRRCGVRDRASGASRRRRTVWRFTACWRRRSGSSSGVARRS